MKVLVGCEYSGTVRDAFIKQGHDAISCDILPTDAEGPIHLGIRDLLDVALPNRAVYHHSPNELDMSGKSAQLAVHKAKARGMRPGWPDFEIILDGRACFLEVKHPSGSLSDKQVETIRDLEVAGALVEVVRSVTEAESVLKKWGLI